MDPCRRRPRTISPLADAHDDGRQDVVNGVRQPPQHPLGVAARRAAFRESRPPRRRRCRPRARRRASPCSCRGGCRLVPRHPQRVRLGLFRLPERLVHFGGRHVERKAGRGQQLRPAGRRRTRGSGAWNVDSIGTRDSGSGSSPSPESRIPNPGTDHLMIPVQSILSSDTGGDCSPPAGVSRKETPSRGSSPWARRWRG